MEGTEIRSGVALLCGFESEYAFSLQLQAEGAYYLEQMQAFHSAFTHYGVNVDIIDQEADLGKYRIVVAPAMYVRSQKASDQLHTFAQNGGIVLLTARSGVKDEHNNCIMQPLPAGYSDMTGCWVEEYDAVGNRKIPVIMDGQYYQGMRWCDIIRTESAETLAVYGENFYAGKAAVTKNSYGKGCVYYIGTVGLPGLCRRLAEEMLRQTDIPYVENLPERVEVTVREGKGKRFTFLFNNDEAAKEFDFRGIPMRMEPFEMKVLEGGEV